ncbi:MAG: AI-2E family transporter [Leptonema sp. (in: bacteria)]
MNNQSTQNTPSYILQIVIILFFLIGSLILVYYVFRSLLWPIFISYLFYTFFDGFNKKLHKKLKSETLSAILLILLIFFIIFLPLTFFIFLLIDQVIDFILWLQIFLEKKNLLRYLFLLKIDNLFLLFFKNPFFWVDILDRVYDISKEYSSFLNYFNITQFLGRAYNIFLLSLEVILKIVLYIFFSFILLFFLFKDGSRFYIRFSQLLPFDHELVDEFKNQLKQVVSAILKGNLLIAILQGIFLALGFVIVGIPNVLLYGFLGSVFSIIPILGTSLVWIPAVLYLYFVKNSLWSALFLGIYCLLTFLILENIVKPKILDKQIGVPSILLFFSILGGLKEFGISGIILGPAILALFIIIWRLYPVNK